MPSAPPEKRRQSKQWLSSAVGLRHFVIVPVLNEVLLLQIPGGKDCWIPIWLFYQLGILLTGVLVVRALLFGVYIKAPDFWKLPV